MALSIKLTYPAQVIVSDPGYPHGKARNQQTKGDGTGTPWEALLVNDFFGFQQSLLVSAGITPSNSPDRVGASQYLDAVKYLTAHVDSLAFFSAGIFAIGISCGNLACFDLNAGGASNFAGVATFQNNLIANGSTQFNGTNQFAGANVFTGAVEFDAAVNAAGVVGFIGSGRIREHNQFFASNSNSSVHPDQGRTCVVPGSVNAVRTYTLLNTGTVDLGDEVEFLNFTTFAHVIGGVLGSPTLPLLAIGKPGRAVFRYVNDGTLSNRWVQVV